MRLQTPHLPGHGSSIGAIDQGPNAFGDVQRIALAIAYLMLPKRIASLPALSWAVAVSWLRGGVEHPVDSDVHVRPAGFAGIVRNPTATALLAAHARGFFPHAHMGPLKWWTREQRYVQVLTERRLPKTLRNEMRRAPLSVTFDEDFEAVIKACAEPRPGRPKLTWITPQIMRLYAQLHAEGHAHSLEIWDESGALVGGGYGVAIGRVFVTESLFSRTGSASKMGLQSLNFHLGAWGFVLNDVKDHAPHLAGMGSRFVPRAEYAALLEQYAATSLPANPTVTPWQPMATLAQIVEASLPPATGRAPKQRDASIRKQPPQRHAAQRPLRADLNAGPRPENLD
jgi:leucyl/phenylalanyl-tRNA---protein transferase